MDRKLIPQGTAVLGLDLRTFSYLDAPEPVLRDIHLEVQPGSLTVISGHSGSGKSTLGAILAGLLPRHSMDQLAGTLSVDGSLVEFSDSSSPRIDIARWSQHVGLLPQDARHYLSGIRGTVAEELAFSLENAGMPREQMHQKVTALAQRLRLDHLLQRHPDQLSGGQERLVALAALAISEPEVLVLDEPLAGLDQQATALVSELISLLRAQGTALVILAGTHHFWAQEADAFWLLDQGTLQCIPDAAQHQIRTETQHQHPAEGAPLMLNMESVRLCYPGASGPAVQDLDLQIRSGEFLGLAGPNGSGKTTVLKAIAGLLQPVAGTMSLIGTTGLLLQNSADQLFERTVLREVSFGIPKKSSLHQRIAEVLAQLGLESYAQTHPYELPASARRLLALATVLVREPKILLLDEPTEGLDELGEAKLRAFIAAVLARGGAVILSTHDEEFMDSVAHRVHHMNQ